MFSDFTAHPRFNLAFLLLSIEAILSTADTTSEQKG